MENLIVAIISFVLGNVTGYFLHMFLSKKNINFDDESRKSFLILVISVVWLISVLVDIASSTYETSPFIHGIMGGIAGYFFYREKKGK